MVSMMDKPQIPEGYKQTELGVIPEDWAIKRIGDALTVRHGRDQKQIEAYHGEYPILATGGEIGRTNTFLYDKPSVLIGRKGTINKPRFIDSPFWTVDTLFYTEVVKNYDPKFIYYKFCLINWMQFNEASGVPSLNASTIEGVIQSFPSCRKEQTAIANTISDVDALITALEKLIHKKTAIKTAAMQQLLTGKKRLPPFDQLNTGYKKTELGEIPEDWEVLPLSELTTLMTNGFVGTAKTHYTESSDGVLYIQGYNVEENSFNFRGIKKVTQEFHQRHSKSCLREGDVLMVQTGDVGLTTIVPKELVGSNCHALIISRFIIQRFDPLYFSYYLNSADGRNRLKDLEVGTTMKHINVGDLLNFLVPVTSNRKEQTAIANVLSDMDTELNALQQRLAKTQQLKQGMMQELLTGKTRLI